MFAKVKCYFFCCKIFFVKILKFETDMAKIQYAQKKSHFVSVRVDFALLGR